MNKPKKENLLIDQLKEKLTVINPNFIKLDIREGSSSYTEDKSTIYICIKDKKGYVYSQNTLMYVLLHEIAHMLNKDNYGHTPEFYRTFERLLCTASRSGIYDPTQPHPAEYCGVNIEGITHPRCN